MKNLLNFISAVLLAGSCAVQSGMLPANTAPKDCVIVSGQVVADGRYDATAGIQALVNSNPGRTIYFPDGIYLISASIVVPPGSAGPSHILLGDHAIVRASANWSEDGGALFRFSGWSIQRGSNAGSGECGCIIEGGVLDGSGIADGLCLEGGCNAVVRRISIVQTRTGVHVMPESCHTSYGSACAGPVSYYGNRTDPGVVSPECSVSEVSIVGNNGPYSVGVLVEGRGNDFADIGIASVHTGIRTMAEDNIFRNIHSLFVSGPENDYGSGCGFEIMADRSWLNRCRSNQFGTGFKISSGIKSNLTDCSAVWTKGRVPCQTAIACTGPLQSIITGFRADFSSRCHVATVLDAETGGDGAIFDLHDTSHPLSSGDVSGSYRVDGPRE